MVEVQHASISTAVYRALVIPLAGSLGALFSAWISDKLFQSRRATVAAIMLILLWAYPPLTLPTNTSLSVGAVLRSRNHGGLPNVWSTRIDGNDHANGFGHQESGSLRNRLHRWHGYIGAGITGVLSGWLIDNLGWHSAFYFWIFAVAVAAILMTILWNHRPVKGKCY